MTRSSTPFSIYFRYLLSSIDLYFATSAFVSQALVGPGIVTYLCTYIHTDAAVSWSVCRCLSRVLVCLFLLGRRSSAIRSFDGVVDGWMDGRPSRIRKLCATTLTGVGWLFVVYALFYFSLKIVCFLGANNINTMSFPRISLKLNLSVVFIWWGRAVVDGNNSWAFFVFFFNYFLQDASCTEDEENAKENKRWVSGIYLVK